MKITVILCTYDRCRSLQNALESVASSKLPESTEWEVLVVDNNSRDQTRVVVEDFSSRYPGRFRYLFEPQPGKSHALNAGIRDAAGSVLAFMDDDVMVDPDWLQKLTASLHSSEWAGVGGRVLPLWSGPPPKWLSLEVRHHLAPLAVFDLPQEAGQISEPPFGTNMAFRKEVFEEYGGFRTDLGPRPGSEIRSEDSEFGQRLLDGGKLLRYEPSAVVYHPVSNERLKKEYHLNWWFDKGRTDIRVHGIKPNTRCFVGKIPLYLFRRLVVWTVRWMVAVEPSRRFDCECSVWGIAGQILECHRLETGKSVR